MLFNLLIHTHTHTAKVNAMCLRVYAIGALVRVCFVRKKIVNRNELNFHFNRNVERTRASLSFCIYLFLRKNSVAKAISGCHNLFILCSSKSRPNWIRSAEDTGRVPQGSRWRFASVCACMRERDTMPCGARL